MLNLNVETCGHEDCTKEASHRAAGSKGREFCSQHAKEGMTSHTTPGRVCGARDGGGHELRNASDDEKQRKRPSTPAHSRASVDTSGRTSKRTRQTDGSPGAVSVAVKRETGGTIPQAPSKPSKKEGTAAALLPCSVKGATLTKHTAFEPFSSSRIPGALGQPTGIREV